MKRYLTRVESTREILSYIQDANVAYPQAKISLITLSLPQSTTHLLEYFIVQI